MAAFKRSQFLAIGALAFAMLALSVLLVLNTLQPGAWGPGHWTAAIVALLGAVIALVAIVKLPGTLMQPVSRIVAAIEEADSTRSGDLQSAAELPALRELVRAVDRLSQQRRSRPDRNAQLNDLLSSMSEAILVTDKEGKIQFINAAAEAILGGTAKALRGRPISGMLENEDSQPLKYAAIGKPTQGLLRSISGATVYISYMISEVLSETGSVERLVFAAQNIDDRRKVEQRIRYLARTDPLTKMANRLQFQHYLQQGIARARRSHQYLALLYLDVDKFKDINDTFGHATGDKTLEIFSRRLLKKLPENAISGRLAGDEFAVIISGFETIDGLVSELRTLADELLNAIGKSFRVQGEEIFMTTSVGVSLYPRDGDNVIDLIRNADAALYQAKKAGGNCYEFYSPDMNVESVERLMLKSKLRRAFENDELRLHYQPKYGLKSGRIEGAEALIRWDQPDHGLLFPSDFIPLAEETNLIVQVGDWVLDKVCADYRRWQRSVPSPCRVSLNLSLRQLQQRRFLEKVRETFESHGVSPTCLELEITETTLMDDTDRTIRILDALYGMGLHLAIDDFGTGYSSLSALQQFPINTLKIDQSFVKDVAMDRDNASIVRTIIQMGHSLGLEIVAEGVESEDQLAFLREEGCDYAQGHLFGDPMTGEEFRDVLIADTEGSGKYRALFG